MTCPHGVSWDDDCPRCEAEGEALCTECGEPWLSCVCVDDAQLALFETTPRIDSHQWMRKVRLKAGRGIEVVRDVMGRVA